MSIHDSNMVLLSRNIFHFILYWNTVQCLLFQHFNLEKWFTVLFDPVKIMFFSCLVLILIIGDSLMYQNGQAFTTKDRDNDPWTRTNLKYKNNCGIYHQGAWWYHSCAHSNLNGLYMKEGKGFGKGMFWVHWKTNWYSTKSSPLMIRRQ